MPMRSDPPRGQHPPARSPELADLGVAKTYRPDKDGAKRFARRYGSQLVCVRQRLSHDGTMRHTTVELLVESTPVASRARSLIALRLPPNAKRLRRLLLAHGAQWRPQQRYWLLAHLVAKNLRVLQFRVPVQG